MAREDVNLRIRALVQGAQDVEQLSGNVEGLHRQAGRRVPDSTRGYRRGVEQSREATERFNRVARQLRSVIGAIGFGVAARSLASFTTNQLASADALEQTAERLSLTNEQLQEYRYAARQINVENRTLELGLQRFSRRLAEARSGGGELADTLNDYNIALEDANGRARDSNAVLRDLADATAQAEDGSEQLRIAFKAFDSEGAALVNLLRGGSDELERMAREARRSGEVIDGQLISSSARLATQLENFRGQVSAAVREGFLQTLVDSTEDLEELFTSEEFIEAMRSIGELLGGIVTTSAEAAKGIVEFGNALGYMAARATHGPIGIEEQIRTLESRLETPWQFPQQRVEEMRAELEELRRTQEMLNQMEPRGGGGGGAGDSSTDGDAGEPTLPPPDTGEADDTTDEIDKIINKLREQRDTYGMTAEAAALYRLRTLGATDAQMEQARSVAQGLEVLRATEQTERAVAQERRRRAQEERRQAEARRRRAESDRELLQELEREIELERMASRERFQAEAAARLSAEATDQQREAVRRLAGQLYDLRDAQESASDEMSEFAKQAARNIQDTFADLLYKPWENSLDEMVRQFANAMQRMAAEALAADLMDWVSNIGNGSSGSGGGSSDSSWIGTAASVIASFFHSGGVVGSGAGEQRAVPVAAFANAPRLHDGGVAGLRSNEVPAVLEEGERVLPKEQQQPGQGRGQGLRIVNVVDPSMAEEYLSSSAGERSVLNIIRRNRGAVREAVS